MTAAWGQLPGAEVASARCTPGAAPHPLGGLGLTQAGAHQAHPGCVFHCYESRSPLVFHAACGCTSASGRQCNYWHRGRSAGSKLAMRNVVHPSQKWGFGLGGNRGVS